MNYEKIIVELLGRIQTLEEQVAILMSNKETQYQKQDNEKMSTADIREYISDLKANARASGKESLVLRSGDIHKDLNLYRCMPSVCNAMYQMMLDGDKILHTTPKGKSSTIEIQYFL